jgi:hypothetical protein
MSNLSRHVCCKCGHSSALKSNFKLTSSGKSFCVKKCLEVYNDHQYNAGARMKGENDATE